MRAITDLKVLDQLVMVNLAVHIWSASKKLRPVDLGNANLPPQELASLGSKKVCNPESLNIFRTLKAPAESILRQNGIKFIGGWTIPQDKLERIDKSLAAIKDEFNNSKRKFLQDYERVVEEWIKGHPEWAGIISNSVVSEDYVRSRLDFRWQIFRISVPAAAEGTQDSLEEEVRNLGNSLFQEISRSAAEIWKNCYEGKSEVSRKALSPLKAMHEKLMGLTFVEPRVISIASLIETAITNIPNKGPIAGASLLMLQGLVSLLRNPEEVVEHGQKMLEGQSASSVLDICLSRINSVSQTQPQIQTEGFDPFAPKPVLESCGLW